MNKKYALVVVILLVLACVCMVPAHAQLSVSIGPTSATIDLGQSESFSSTVSSGSGNYSFQWYLNHATVSGATSSSWTFTPQSTGSYIICLAVKDLNTGMTANSQPNATITVHTALTVSISPSTVTIDVGQSQTFTAAPSGGTSPYQYWWSLNKGSYSGPFANPTWTFTPSSPGYYNVTCKVTDSSTPDIAPTWPSIIAYITVNSAPSVSILPTSVAVDVGQSQVFSSSVLGGTSPYSYQWCLNGAAVSGATSSSWTLTTSSSGSYSVYVNVTDSAGFRVKSNIATVTANAAPSVSTSPYTITWVDSQPLTFTESVTGGTSPYTYYWGHGLNASQAYSDMGINGPTASNTWTFTFDSAGNWIIICNVFDSAKGTPVLGPWGSTAYVNVIHGFFLQLSANVTVPNLAFTVNGTRYSGSVTLPLKQGNYTVTVSPTYLVRRIGRLYTIEYEFVQWSNGSTNATLTITLNQTTNLIAYYYITVTGYDN